MVFSLILTLCSVNGREQPVLSRGVVDWFDRPLNQQPVVWSDNWSQFLDVYSVLFLFSEVLTMYMYALTIYSMVHCGSTFKSGVSDLPDYYTSICVYVPTVLGAAR